MTTLTEGLLSGTIYDEQIKLEQKCIHDGVLRYRKMVSEATKRGDAACLKPAERMMLHWLGPLSAAIREEKTACKGIRRMPHGRRVYGPVLLALPSRRLAVLAMHEALGLLLPEPHGVMVVRVAYSIGRAALAEIELERLRLEDRADRRKKFKAIRDRAEAAKSAGEIPEYEPVHSIHEPLLKSRAFNEPKWIHRYAKKNLSDPMWNREVCVQTGVILIWLLLQTASVGPYTEDGFELAFHHFKKQSKTKRTAYLKIDEKVYQIIEQGHEARSFIRPRYTPMIVEPMPWGEKKHGGYIRLRTNLVTKTTPQIRTALDKADMSFVHKSLNALNSTAWKINKEVLDIAKQYWASGGGVECIPHADDLPIPPKPETDDSERLDAWRKEAVKVHRTNVRTLGLRQSFIFKIDVADRMADQPALYFPHMLDFTSRAYPNPQHLNHQGDDLCRGLLTFAAAKVLGESGWRWLRIHAANCWGMDKVDMRARVGWADANMDMMRAVAQNPLECEQWRHADKGDKAWQFLAACFEVDRAIRETNGHPERHASSLPIQLDATCSAIQHYAALTRDHQTACKVNLVDTGKREDIYDMVAEASRLKVMQDSSRQDVIGRIASSLAEYVTRDVCKQPTMTDTYGVTMVGARLQVQAKLKKANYGVDNRQQYEAARYLSKQILGCLAELCPAVTQARDWLESCARIITQPPYESDVTWITPIGFPVVQPYRKPKVKLIHTILQMLTLSAHATDTKVKPGKQVSGFSPNFIHSLDATHMHMIAVACLAAEIDFAGVHDCFWTHHATADTLNRIVRNEFARLYETDQLDSLYQQFKSAYPDAPLQEPTITGDFRPDAILTAEYAIS